MFEGDRRFDIVVRLPEAHRGPIIEALRNRAGPACPTEAAASAMATDPAQAGRDRSPHGEGPNQISRENGKRRVVVTANVRGRDIASLVAEAQAKIAAAGPAPAGLLDHLGRPVREPGRGAAAADDRRAGLLRVDLPAALRRARLGARCAAGVQRRAAGTDRRHRRAVAARHAVLDLGGGRLHRAVGRRRAERPGDAHLHQAAHGAGRAAAGGDL